MPELSEIELARSLFEVCPSCRIFLVSATELSLIEAGAAKAPTPNFRFFGKPIQMSQLLDAAAYALHAV